MSLWQPGFQRGKALNLQGNNGASGEFANVLALFASHARRIAAHAAVAGEVAQEAETKTAAATVPLTIDYQKTAEEEKKRKANVFLASVEEDDDLSSVGDEDEGADDGLETISLREVRNHDMENDAWMVIYDYVYDLTEFFNEHPGGAEVMMENAGRDATTQFRSVGHSADAAEMLRPYLIGILPPRERMYSGANRKDSLGL